MMHISDQNTIFLILHCLIYLSVVCNGATYTVSIENVHVVLDPYETFTYD